MLDCREFDGGPVGLEAAEDISDGDDGDSSDGDEFAITSSSVEDDAELLKCLSIVSDE